MSHETPTTRLVAVFFSADSLKRILTYLCNTRPPNAWDPVTATVLDFLTSRLQLCLTPTGLAPFKGQANLIYPYHMMTVEQKDFLRAALEERTEYATCNESVVFKSTGQDRLDAVSVLEAMCSKVLESNVHAERSVREGVCNILLQRVQSVVPIPKSVQQQLNARLFESK